VLTFNLEAGQSLRVGDDIRIVAVNLEPGRASLGVEAPDRIPVDRGERRERQERERGEVASIGRPVPRGLSRRMEKYLERGAAGSGPAVHKGER
jgi:sRNA-binding carbon storage regulator CsrA